LQLFQNQMEIFCKISYFLVLKIIFLIQDFDMEHIDMNYSICFLFDFAKREKNSNFFFLFR
jgi:hypothetical protein